LLFTICLILFFSWIALVILIRISNRKRDNELLREIELQMQEAGKTGVEIRKRFQETATELDELDEQMEETNARMSETNIQMDEVIKRMSERSGEMGMTIKQLGKVIEEASQSDGYLPEKSSSIKDTLLNYGISKLKKEIDRINYPEELEGFSIGYYGKAYYKNKFAVELSIFQLSGKNIKELGIVGPIKYEDIIKPKKKPIDIQDKEEVLIPSFIMKKS